MAAPPEISLHNISGKWSMNMKLSDDFDGILEMQGLPWLLRRLASLASLTLTVSQNTTADGVNRIEIQKKFSGGLATATENYVLDGSTQVYKDPSLGEIKGRVSWIKYKDIQAQKEAVFLSKGIRDEGEELIHENVVNEARGWEVTQIWGFEEINGARRYVKHGVITKGKKRIAARSVYDYVQSAQ